MTHPGKPSTVIDADGHVLESHAVKWEDWLEEPYKKMAPQRAPFDTGGGRLFMEGKFWPMPYPDSGNRINQGSVIDIHNSRQGMWDPRKRLPDMDIDQIDVAVLFGGAVGLGVAGIENTGYAAALSRAYNNWLHQYCSADPKRLKGVASIPIQDAEAAVIEAERAVKDLGMVALGTFPNVKGKNLDHPDFYPVYGAAQRLDVPVCVHGGPGFPNVWASGTERFGKKFWYNLAGFPFELMVQMSAIVCGGVMDRYPNVRFGFFEGWAGWVPFLMERLHEHYEKLGAQVAAERDPEEYMLGPNFYYSCEYGEKTLHIPVELMGAEHILYASDYWHWDAKFPGTVDEVLDNQRILDDAKRKILGENAARFYKINGKSGPKSSPRKK